jgi:hypothetical protein
MQLMSNNYSINQINSMTTTQIQQLRYLHAKRKHATGIYHDCLKRKASATERHAAEAACTATMDALKAFTATT